MDFLLNLSIITPEYSPQKSPINVTIPNINENAEFKSKLFVKYHGILIIAIPEAMPAEM